MIHEKYIATFTNPHSGEEEVVTKELGNNHDDNSYQTRQVFESWGELQKEIHTCVNEISDGGQEAEKSEVRAAIKVYKLIEI